MALRLTEEEYNRLFSRNRNRKMAPLCKGSSAKGGEGLKKNKYNAKKVLLDGILFASQHEADRYNDLKLMLRAGEISDLKTQVKYVLIPAKREPDKTGPRGGIKKGKVIEREVAYFADFVYKTKDGAEIVEDAKGYREKSYKLKRKLMLAVHGIKIKET